MTPQFNSRKKTNGHSNVSMNKVEEIDFYLKKKEREKTLLIMHKCLSSEQS